MPKSTFGHIERLGKNLYRCYWHEDGRRRSHRVHGSLDDAKDYLASRRIGLAGCSDRTTWREFWAAVVEPSFDGLAAKTVHNYRRIWERHLAPTLGRRTVASTNAQAADRALARIASPASQKAAKALGRKICNMAVREGILERNPFVGAKTARAGRRRKEPYTAREVEAWLRGMRGSKYEAALICELGAGLRHEEACALTWEDVAEWNGKAVLRVNKALTTVNGRRELKGTKTADSERVCIMGEPFASRVLELRGKGPLVPSAPGTDVRSPCDIYANPATITHNYRDWCRKHGIRYVCPRDLRSTFATLHGEAGSQDSMVALAMGHTDGTTKGRHYQQRTIAGLAMIADNLAEYLCTPDPDLPDIPSLFPLDTA